MTALRLVPGAEPFFFPGGPVGCLLIHGFTGTPLEMRGLGERLADRGYTVFAPRLTHHGTQPADMSRSRWHDWYLSALDGWHLLHSQCERVVPAGLSMGGVTALLLAARQSVGAVISMSAPVRPPDRRMHFARLFWRVVPSVAKPKRSVEPLVPSYQVHSLRSVTELMGYLRAVDEALPQIKAPALIMHARGDTEVPGENLDYIYERIGSKHKEKVWIENGSHVVTEDSDKEFVYDRIVTFLVEQVG